ncbi:ubiquitin carboxyl-terminal hydrolase CYLD-like isoform X2 [Halichondria panicea]|uniref:ubiquitin carboxyl-terminal hydrolase CYLD-like isoform X2 n=1 Tax=Halichondria panicea TaxID=6063 RepID=UPI00312B53BA
MAKMADYLYILMKDVYGEKAPVKIMSVSIGSPKPVQVLRGELLALIHHRELVQRYEGRPPHNYRSTKDTSVTLYGGEDDEYVSPLGRDLQLLEAIERPSDRYAVFSEDSKLEWGGRLKKCDQVYVRLPTPAPTWSAGAVRYVGPVESLSGRNFGVEITTTCLQDSRYLGKGSSDGFFGGCKYFDCDQDCGLFVSLDKLAAKPPHQVPHGSTRQQLKSSSPSGVNSSTHGSPIDKPPTHMFKINDRVVVYNRKKEPMGGTVRWIGRDLQTRTLDTNHIGIETDSIAVTNFFPKALTAIAVTNFFPKALTAITHLFKAKSGYRLVLPEHFVFREELANTRDVDLSDPAAVAREEGLSKGQFMAAQKKALKDAEEAKRKENRKKTANVQPNMKRVTNHTHVAPQNTGDADYINIEAVEQHAQSRQNDQPNQPSQLNDYDSSRSSNFYNLAVGSTVQVATINPNEPPHYGVIRWTGRVAGVDGQVAGIELEDYMDGCTDGTFTTTGEKYFTCTFGHGLYFPLANLRPDERFGLQAGHAASSVGNPIKVPMEEQTDQFINDPTEQMLRYIGNSRGIQGHQNSCYLDSTIFGLFALSDVFDTIFLDPDKSNITSDQNRKRVAHLLWKGRIVNPLRKNGVVRFESVMKMRNALEELGKMEGITEKEKDPEEFLNMLFKHVLHTRPFISIRRPFGVEEEFFVQLFVEYDPNLRPPTVGDLLRKMFLEQHISFTKVPSKLLLQVPRFGREFQIYKKIVPELKLDIRELTDAYKKAPTPACHSCGEESTIQCESCGPLSQQQFTHYCQRCSDLFHSNPSHKDRANHRLTVAVAATPADDPELAQLDLLSVICIETSHYVCFTRDPRDDIGKKWIFFDSMADRQYDTYNIPRVTDCTRELNEWVYEGDQDRLINTPPRELPELVRRFTQDIYMCVYVQPDVAMYGDGAEEDHQPRSVREPYSIITELSKLMESKDDIVEELKQEITTLQAKNRSLQQRIETNQAEQSQHIQLLEAEKEQLLQHYNERERTTSQEMAEKEEQMQQQKQNSDNEKRQLEKQKQHLESQSQRYQQQAQDMQQRRLEVAESQSSQSKFSELQIPRLDQDSWNVRRQEVVLQDNLGHGAWGSVC